MRIALRAAARRRALRRALSVRQFAALHGIEADVLQRLQRRAQRLPLRPVHAARDQAEAAVFGAQHLDQQAGFAPGARVQDEAGSPW